MKTGQRSGDQELPPQVLAEWRREAIRTGQRPEEFWARQQMHIRARLQSQGERKPMRVWVAVATAVVVFFVVLLAVPAGPRRPKAPPQATVDADQELRLGVGGQKAVHRGQRRDRDTPLRERDRQRQERPLHEVPPCVVGK